MKTVGNKDRTDKKLFIVERIAIRNESEKV